MTIIRAVSRPKYSSSDRPLIEIVPLPCRKKTRATEVFLLPVALITFSAISIETPMLQSPEVVVSALREGARGLHIFLVS